MTVGEARLVEIETCPEARDARRRKRFQRLPEAFDAVVDAVIVGEADGADIVGEKLARRLNDVAPMHVALAAGER